MSKNDIVTGMIVQDVNIRVLRHNDIDYISLTDLAKHQNSSDPSFTIKNWMRKINTLSYLALWESLHNIDFNLVEFDQIKRESGKNSFSMSPSQWIKRTSATGIISKAGRYSMGTFAHPDIAFEFASWLSPEFKLYLITEFERLKSNEAYQNKIEWQATRLLSKANYLIHTDAIQKYIVPEITEDQKKFIYADEADVLNVALFGITAKEWRQKNPELAKTGNIRDYTDLLHLIVLNNLQTANANMIEDNIPQEERLLKLNTIAKNQIKLLQDNKNIKELEKIQSMNLLNDAES